MRKRIQKEVFQMTKTRFRLSALVLALLMLLAVLGGGGYYVKQQMDIYRVPTPLELSLMENSRLQKQHDELLNDYYQADEQVAMSKSLAHLNSELARLQAELAAIRAKNTYYN